MAALLSLQAAAQQEVVTSLSTFSTYDSGPNAGVAPQKVAYKVTYPPGFRMRNVGRTMTVAGAALLVGGIVVFDQADKTVYTVQTSSGTYNEIDPKVALGILMIVHGVGLAVPGIILWTRGTHKFNRYLEQQMTVQVQGGGLTLQLRF